MTQQQQPAEGDTITVPDLRALDALVELHVDPNGEIEARKEEGKHFEWPWILGTQRTAVSAMVPHYTTDPRDWMAVVKKMRGEGWRFDLNMNYRDNWVGRFVKSDPKGWPSIDGVALRADEQPGVAISLAAVEAKTGKRVVVAPTEGSR